MIKNLAWATVIVNLSQRKWINRWIVCWFEISFIHFELDFVWCGVRIDFRTLRAEYDFQGSFDVPHSLRVEYSRNPGQFLINQTILWANFLITLRRTYFRYVQPRLGVLLRYSGNIRETVESVTNLYQFVIQRTSAYQRTSRITFGKTIWALLENRCIQQAVGIARQHGSRLNPTNISRYHVHISIQALFILFLELFINYFRKDTSNMSMLHISIDYKI